MQGGERVLYCAGQTSVYEDGEALHAGNFTEQMNQALDNLESVLDEAGLTLAHVVRLNYCVTDMDALETGASLGARMAKVGCKPAPTLLKVTGLFHPDLMVEIKAAAIE